MSWPSVLEAPQLVPVRLAGRIGGAIAAVVDAHAQDVRVGAEGRDDAPALVRRALAAPRSVLSGSFVVWRASGGLHRVRRGAAAVVPGLNVTIRRLGSSPVGWSQAGPPRRNEDVLGSGDAAWAGIVVSCGEEDGRRDGERTVCWAGPGHATSKMGPAKRNRSLGERILRGNRVRA